MVKVVTKDINLAPMHNSSERVQNYAVAGESPRRHPLVIPFTAGIYANGRLLQAMGELPCPERYDSEEFNALKPSILPRPTTRLLQTISQLSPKCRKELTRQMETDLGEQMGRSIRLDDRHPSAPLLIWSDRQMNVLTADNRVLWGVRSNSTKNNVSHFVPPGSGFASVDEAGKPLSPKADAARELYEEAGLRLEKTHALGVDRRGNTLGAFPVKSEDGTKVFVGVLPAFSHAEYCETGHSRDVLPTVTLNNESFATGVTTIPELERLVCGERVAITCFPSTARPAGILFKEAQNLSGKGAIQVEAMRDNACRVDALKIPSGNYALDLARPIQIQAGAEHFKAVGRDFLAEALQMVELAGRTISPEAQRYVREHSNLERTDPACTIGSKRGATVKGHRFDN